MKKRTNLIIFLFFSGILVTGCAKRNFKMNSNGDLLSPEGYLYNILVYQTLSGSGGGTACPKTFTLPVINNFVADGNPSEFTASSLFITDPAGDSTGTAGQDLLNVHLAIDGSTNILVHYQMDTVIPNGTYIQIGLLGGYLINGFIDGGGVPTWVANMYPNTPIASCNNITTNITVSGGDLEFKFPYSCLEITAPYQWDYDTSYPQEVTVQPGTNYDKAIYDGCVSIDQ